MSGRLAVAAVALASTLAGCTGVADEIRAGPAPTSTAFHAAELVDVLPPDAVPSIDRPSFEDPAAASERLDATAPVAVVRSGDDARAYPLAILVWHEIVNDTIGGEEVVITYAPLTGTAAAYRRTAAGRVLTFAGSGKLYRSNLVMYDRATRSLWPQLLGAATLGPLTGTSLVRLPVQVISFGDFRGSFPEGRVLTAATGAARVYGATPYPGYESRETPSDSFFAPAPDRRLDPMERVVGVTVAGASRAYPVSALRTARVVHDRVGGTEIVLLWRDGNRSALDTPLIADGRDVGSTGVFVPSLDGRRLELAATSTGFIDRQTGSSWTVLGVAIGGPLRGRRLTPVTHADAFWFAWAAFTPSTTVSGRR